MHVLLTGASGFVGQATLKALIKRGATVQATSTTGQALWESSQVSWLAWNADTEAIPPQDIDYSKIDSIIHLASPRGRKLFPEQYSQTFRTNTVASVELANIAAKNSIPFVYASTGDVFGAGPEVVTETESVYSPTSFYAFTKASAELLLRPFSDITPVAIMRLFHPYGPGGDSFLVNRLVQRVLAGETISVERNGGILLNPVWIDDLADGLCTAIERQVSGIFHLAGNETVRLENLVETIAELAGVDVNMTTADADPPGGHAGIYERATSEFAFNPETSLVTGLQHLICQETIAKTGIVTDDC
jgi:nucleoside-diphosphate-sugar epimerase